MEFFSEFIATYIKDGLLNWSPAQGSWHLNFNSLGIVHYLGYLLEVFVSNGQEGSQDNWVESLRILHVSLLVA